MLGEFEYLLLTSAARLGEDAYGVAIRLDIENSICRACSIGALYTTLDRLEAKGLVKSSLGDATPRRGGRPKRMVRVTAQGMQAAAAFYDTVLGQPRYLLEERFRSAMSRFRRFLLDGLSRLLESDARDVVIGDLAELNLGSLRSVRELCGLIVRRQVSLWKVWRPWLALLGIVGLVGIRLNFLASSLTGTPWRNLSTYLKYGARYERGLTTIEEIVVWLALAAAVVLWSWTAGFAFTSLSRKTAPFTITLLCIVWLCWSGLIVARSLFVLPWFYVLLWLIPSMLFFLPAVLGARRAFRRGDLSLQRAIVLLALTAA